MLGDPAKTGRDNALNSPAQLATIQPTYSATLRNTAPPPTQHIIQPHEQVTPLPMPTPLPPVWPAISQLVEGRNGRYQQSDQIPEIQACLRGVVRRANANLALVDGFPSPHRRGQWLAEALVSELRERRKGSMNMAAVDDRAQQDGQYFNNLLYMVSPLLVPVVL